MLLTAGQGSGEVLVPNDGAVGCVLTAAATPLMELVPFSANVAGIAVTSFGLALIAADGLMALARQIHRVAARARSPDAE